MSPGSLPLVGIDASRGFVLEPTGTERYATEVTRRLTTRDDLDARLYFRGDPGTEPPAGSDTRVMPAGRLWTHTRLAIEVAREPPDLLFIPSHVMPVVTRPPAVVTVHDLGYLAHPDAHTGFQQWYLDWTTSRHVRAAARIVADSESTKRDLIRAYHAEPDRVDVVHLGVGDAYAPSAEARARARNALGVPESAWLVLHVGTIQPRKNLGTLLEAFEALAAEDPDAVLVLAGAEGWGPALRDMPAYRRLDRRVLHAGYVADDDLPDLYAAADAYALPSLYEGFGLTALEAMATGVPVVAANTSSLPEVVDAAGLLVEPTETGDWVQALRRLRQDSELAAGLAAAGRSRAAGFTWDRTAQGVAQSLHAALAAGRMEDR